MIMRVLDGKNYIRSINLQFLWKKYLSSGTGTPIVIHLNSISHSLLIVK